MAVGELLALLVRLETLTVSRSIIIPALPIQAQLVPLQVRVMAPLELMARRL